ncbi:collagen type IV alpha-3-binding protein-like [Limulus polyphemus]|uniref:Ceramide transfer protein n=1 Tax=Limulus polyphemus TaxID=6850 RepID=A0ABM1TM87_LIMPO|nr:collagen type IV alpha-3-binding protein-like [Limulus polyphemus]XP_022256993.1 collagen type IV alpha-3-binding protein-like [Limulus polyphemus]
MYDDHSLSDDEDFENEAQSSELQGTLSKWTNYIHGWQSRYIILKNGALSYYKSENDAGYGCRGSVSIHKATIKPHEFDECRFDVSVHDCVWYLRTDCPEERNRWVEILETCKADSAYGSESSLRRHGSAISLGSANFSTASVSSFKKAISLKVKLAEMETFRDILCRQVDMLQSYFDTCADTVATTNDRENYFHLDEDIEDNLTSLNPDVNPEDMIYSTVLSSCKYKDHIQTPHVTKELLSQHGSHAVDFKGEAVTFKATTAGILSILAHCIDIMQQREENWKHHLEKEVEKTKRLDELYKHAVSEAKSQQPVVLGGPDYEEGPHCVINEEEFFDAIDASLDKNEQHEEERRNSRNITAELAQFLPSILKSRHKLWSEIEAISMEQLSYAKMGVGEGGWQLFAEDGEMKMYRRELEEGGMVLDPLKAVHVVQGVTGHEVCHYFFSPDVRFDWETTLESMKIIEEIDSKTLIFHQVHKRVWPATQRDALFWSHMRQVPNNDDSDAQTIWLVCNHSTDHEDVPVGKCVRVFLTISLVCQTFVDPPAENEEINRENLMCKIIYCSTINPGGWTPASVLRAVYKREYPKFLKRFTQYVKDMTETKPIMF